MFAFAIKLVVLCCGTTLGSCQIFDLTWPFNNDSVYWPGHTSFNFTSKTATIRPDGTWYASNEFTADEHGGTHLDAPYHFNKEGWKVQDIPLDRLIVPGVMIDLSKETERQGSATLLQEHHLKTWKKQNWPLPEKCLLLVRFGWGQYYWDKYKYLGIRQDKSLSFPGISKEAAEWIAGTGRIVGVGTDTASIDPGSSQDFAAHKTFAANQMYNLENVKFPDDLPGRGYTLYVMPMKIEEGTGAPLRLIAVPHASEESVRSSGRTVDSKLSIITVLICTIIVFLYSHK